MRNQTCFLLTLSIAGSVCACTSTSSTTNPAMTSGADGSVEPSDNDGGDETTTDGGAGGGKDSGKDGAEPEVQYKRMFVTSATYEGDLKTAGNAPNGLAGADKLCMVAATGAGLGGTWKAFISGKVGSSTVNAPDRIAGSGPWLLVSGNFVAFETRSELSTGIPHGRLDMDETGKRLGTPVAWTGTKLGAYQSPACELAGNSWENSDSGTKGVYGAPALQTGQEWANFGTNDCDLSAHLYCFEK